MKVSYLAGIAGGLLVATAMSGGACTYNYYNSGTGGSAASTASSASGTSSASGMTTSSSSGGGMVSSSSGTGGSGGSGGMGGASSSSANSSSSSSASGCPDADGDGYTSKACGGTDCNDNDNQAYPGQAKYFDKPTKGTMSFDYNCDGMETPQIEFYKCNVACAMKQNVFLVNDTPCGQMGTVGDCAAVTCAMSNTTIQPRLCH